MKEALLSRTGKSTQAVFLGEAVSAVLGFLINIVLLRRLSVNDYGLFSLFMSTMMLLAGFSHFGWIETFVRFGARHRESDVFPALRWYVFKRTIAGALAVAGITAAASPWIAAHLLKREGFEGYLVLAALGAVVFCVFSFAMNDYRVRLDFAGLLLGRVGSAAARLLFCLGAILVGVFTLLCAVLIYALTPLLFVVPSVGRWWKESRDDSRGSELASSVRAEMGAYNFWILISFLTVTLIGNVDSYFLAYYHDNRTVSAFGAASRLTLPIQMVITSLTTTLLPRLSAMHGVGEMRSYLRKISLFLLPASLLVLLACWIAPPILIFLAGKSYEGITGLLRLQILTSLVVLLVNPIGLILSAWGLSKWLAVMNVVQLAVDLVLDYLWVPRWGATGAVAATLAINVIGMVSIYAGVWIGFRNRESS